MLAEVACFLFGLFLVTAIYASFLIHLALSTISKKAKIVIGAVSWIVYEEELAALQLQAA